MSAKLIKTAHLLLFYVKNLSTADKNLNLKKGLGTKQ